MTSPTRWSPELIGLLLAGYAVVLAAVMWTETDTGTLEVQLNGAPVNVSVEQDGKELSIFRTISGPRITLYRGDYRLSLQDPSGKYRLETESLHIDRGAAVVVAVTPVP